MPAPLLVSDFDGTITGVDFYHLVVSELLPSDTPPYFQDYLAGRCTHFEALHAYFSCLRVDEATMADVLRRTQPDPDLADGVARLRRAGWEIVVVSAGCRWYIERILADAGVDLPVLANPGTFSPTTGLQMTRAEGPFASPQFGVDKRGVVEAALAEGRVVAFAGDGVPDAPAARRVDPGLRFARAALADVLTREGLPFRPFGRWNDVVAGLLEDRNG